MKDRVAAVLLQEPGITIDYIEIADPETLAPLDKVAPKTVLLAAIRVGRTRLIDNIVL